MSEMTRQMIAIGLCIVTIVLLIASTNVSYIVRLSEGPIDRFVCWLPSA
jgi:hypothetical protein